MASPVLVFVPLDGRPVTMDIVADLGRAAGVDVRTPDRVMLSDRFRLGEVDRVWEWLEREAAGGSAALIASVETLCFGGLVASRKSEVEFEEIVPRLHRLYEIASRLPTYVSAVIPRTPQRPTDEDAAYWKTGDQAAMLQHRNRHLQLNADLISAASRGVLDSLLIGQDDTTPGSQSEADRATLQRHAAASSASNALLTSGTDELNARLFARWLNDLTGAAPSVQLVYTYPETTDLVPRYEALPLRQTVEEHVRSAGAHLLGDDSDVLLWVHNFTGQQREAVDQTGELDVGPTEAVMNTVREAARRERVVALADVRFANGADRALLAKLLAEPRFGGIVAYAGWNTCSNSLGSVMASATVVHHLRAGTVPGNDRIYRPAFFTRILDDWGYQSLVRPQLTRWLEERGGEPSDLSEHETALEAMALEKLRGETVPALQRSFAHHPLVLRRATLPWHRLFEVRIELEILPSHRGSRQGIVIVDYDEHWPELFERERLRIAQALSDLAVTVEHVGSTAVASLAAKPVIDIMVGVDSEQALDRCIERIKRLGYEYDPDWEVSMPNRRYFPKMDSEGRHTHHIHVVLRDSAFWRRHVAFRDYLRTHPEKAREYGDLKKRLAGQHQGSIDYTFAKTEFIRSVEALSGVMHRQRGPR